MTKVVLVPGFTQTASSWDGVRGILDATCDVVALDVPVRETFGATADAIAARGQRAVYVGYSMGGRLCLRLALDHPHLVPGLVLVSATPGIVDDATRRARVASDEQLASSIERDGVDAFLERWLAQPLFATVPPDAPGLAERALLPARHLTHCLRVLGTGVMEPMWAELTDLTMPVALVTGTLDRSYEVIAAQMVGRIGSRAEHARLEGGHSLPLEQPAALAGFIGAFAAEHG
ncbi:MAG: 2-succinyl-6-hydroxy-2,4-cyclohexadiene-carboxylate synthase [Actinomycetota bacterium]|nr:2-succinyl-6-hydroxy-2,4-cyclohexadiene-carboxylate synthase [Actinomycetota bacterium]